MRTKHLFTAFTAAFTLAACSNDNNEVITESQSALQLQAYIAAQTRVAGGAFEVGDAIGVYAVSTAAQGLTSGTNVKYVATNTTADFTAEAPIYFQDRNDVNISAYYPYVADLKDNVTSVALKDQTDILYAKKDKVAYNETNLSLAFDHVLTQLTLVLKASDGVQNLDALTSVTLKNLTDAATWNVLTGTLTNGNTKSDYSVTSFTANEDGSKTLSLLAFPVSGETSIDLEVTYDGVDYDATLIAGSGLIAGNNYTYTVNLKQSGLSISGSTINKWVEAEFKNAEDANADAKLKSDSAEESSENKESTSNNE
jgi:hypothetical protein